jgi:maltose alpha-D-glucosyltransferase/alpha-amylase
LYLPITIDPEYHYEAVNVEAQQNNPYSLLWWMKRLIAQRKGSKAFGRGTLEFLTPSNRRVLAFIRRYEEEIILIVANLSRFPQHAELDLSKLKGMTPVELFGRAEFPPIGDQPYMITIGAHGFLWFAIENRAVSRESIEAVSSGSEKPLIHISSTQELDAGRLPYQMLRMLPEFLQTRRWFLGKGRTILSTTLIDVMPIPETSSYIGLLRVEYSTGDPDIYVLPAAVATGEAAAKVLEENLDLVFARTRFSDGQEGVLYTAAVDPAFSDALLGAIARRRRIKGRDGELLASHTRAFRRVWGATHPALQPVAQLVEQRNTSIAFGDRFMLKLFRRLEPGVNPEIEMTALLTEHSFQNSAPLTGSIEYRPDEGDPMSVAILTGFVTNQGNAWNYTLDSLGRFFEQALARVDGEVPGPQNRRPLALARMEVPHEVRDLLGEYVEAARLLGQRSAEMHAALASDPSRPDFAAEPFTDHYRQGLYHGLIAQAGRCLSVLRQSSGLLSPEAQADAQRILAHEEEVRMRFRPVRDRRIETKRIRIHGDYNLGEVLYTGKDFVIIDFEGDPTRTYGERRIKRSPLRDVAGMLRSLQYAAYAALFGRVPGVLPKPEAAASLAKWASFWAAWTGAMFLTGYLSVAGAQELLPSTEDDLRVLLDAFLLEKALAEVRVELSYRPDWAIIPLRGIANILES